MAQFVLIATIETAPGRRSDFVPLLMAHRARCREEEPGTIQFDVLLPQDDATKVVIYEMYRDETAFDAHAKGPSLARMRKEAAGLIVKTTGARYSVVE